MELEITKKEEQPLLKKTAVAAKITFQGSTPSRKEVVAGVAKAMKAKNDVVIVKSIATKYGEQHADVEAAVYADRKSLEAHEYPATIKKHTFEEKKEPEAEKADAPKEEKAESPEKEAAPEKGAEKPAEEAAPPKDEPKQEKPAEKEEKPEANDAAKPEEKAEKKEE